jgi:hypothetical protein
VVSEPPDDDMDAECEDIGVAFVSVKEILMTKKDVEEQNVDRKYSVVSGSCNTPKS